ncbi:MAG: hypothetical protein A2275_05125 [Bacteroidetes bacterium RIFOXYA12_FULL_35_11]|nr:MAG: hypothetical protein A2X01_15795 [Bacteroidetes bacterium GWF2_35_48]OFY81453.1 MAG: hypothetical protein A2275_05125 [Bacteroidetes bacterium RIFOXYA12_FULL_35_11]OFZ05660.1 MAG: hypothetical protein A2491_20420 [Bacteroidetes bacterium RIFOXYC12_FULL_35_7]HBX52698.1 hypothetical protein [Bacteroidales bacterium]
MYQKSTLFYFYSTLETGIESGYADYSMVSDWLNAEEKEPSADTINNILGFSDSYYFLDMKSGNNVDLILN